MQAIHLLSHPLRHFRQIKIPLRQGVLQQRHDATHTGAHSLKVVTMFQIASLRHKVLCQPYLQDTLLMVAPAYPRLIRTGVTICHRT